MTEFEELMQKRRDLIQNTVTEMASEHPYLMSVVAIVNEASVSIELSEAVIAEGMSIDKALEAQRIWIQGGADNMITVIMSGGQTTKVSIDEIGKDRFRIHTWAVIRNPMFPFEEKLRAMFRAFVIGKSQLGLCDAETT